jgi:hypothetical protein
MIRRDADFVDPQLCRLVRMDVVHAGGKSDHLPLIDRYRQVMAGVTEEFARQSWIDRIVEDARRDAGQERLTARIENSRLQCLAPLAVELSHEHDQLTSFVVAADSSVPREELEEAPWTPMITSATRSTPGMMALPGVPN